MPPERPTSGPGSEYDDGPLRKNLMKFMESPWKFRMMKDRTDKEHEE